MGWRLNRDKSRQFANTAALRRWLAAQTPLIPAGRQFRDLGVVAAAGRVPRCAVAGSRARAAGVRFARIGRLPLEFRHRCMLGAAAGTSAGLYGASCGRPPAMELAGLRAAARQAVCRGGFRAAAEVVFGVLSPTWRLDPAAVVALAPLWQASKALRRGRFPLALWRATDGARAAGHGRGAGPVAAAAWSLAQLRLGDDVERWTGVPACPDGWRPADQPLQATRAVLLEAWARREAAAVAGRRADFAHVARGVDRWATRRLLETGALAPDAAGALRAVLSGNVVTESVAAKWGKPARCPHCGAACEDREHRFWVCPAWGADRAAALATARISQAALRARLPPGVANTGVLATDVRLAALAEEATRALPLAPLPAAQMPVPPQSRRRAWTDGACERPQDPLMARAAWGLRLEGPRGTSDHSGPVDAAQTAQRAELTAAVQAVSLAGAPVEVITDSRYVRNGVAALRAGACYLDWTHSDLWER
eukprot:4693944-Pyramimonas_sp.AAC.1